MEQTGEEWKVESVEDLITWVFGSFVYGLVDEVREVAEANDVPWPSTIGFEVACWAFNHVAEGLQKGTETPNTPILVNGMLPVIYSSHFGPNPPKEVSPAVEARTAYYDVIETICVDKGDTLSGYWVLNSGFALEQFRVQTDAEKVTLRMGSNAWGFPPVRNKFPIAIAAMGPASVSQLSADAQDAVHKQLFWSTVRLIAPLPAMFVKLQALSDLRSRPIEELKEFVTTAHQEAITDIDARGGDQL